jgi:hypothetical protein
VASAEERGQASPDTYPLYGGLLADVNMLMVEQARSAMARSSDLIKEALRCSRKAGDVEQLAANLDGPLVHEPMAHSATIGPKQASELGLPVEEVDQASEQWKLIWRLWTRYFHLITGPAAEVSVYEGDFASQIRYRPRTA